MNIKATSLAIETVNDFYNKAHKQGYEEGVEEAWATAKFALLNASNDEVCRTFKINKWQELFNDLTGVEAINRLKERISVKK